MRWGIATILVLAAASPTQANDWEKFYRPVGSANITPSEKPTELLHSSGDSDKDMEDMWRRGFAPVGVSAFNSSNGKTSDALKFGKKIRASHVMIATDLVSSTMTSIPLTIPKTTNSVTNGTASVQSSGGGYASGMYSGTTTTYGSQTTYIPIAVNRFEKIAVYYTSIPKMGLGIMTRDLTPEEMATLETRRALAVRFVRDNSPAFVSDILPGDILVQIEGQPFNKAALDTAMAIGKPFPIKLYRNGQYRDLTVSIPRRR